MTRARVPLATSATPVVSRGTPAVGPNASLLAGDLASAIRKLKVEHEGEIEVGGQIGVANTGARVRINDPVVVDSNNDGTPDTGRYGRPDPNADIRFQVDQDNPTILAERAFHTTSDFPALLSAAANKMLLAAYAPAQPTYRTLFLRRDFRDFKPHRHLRVGDFPNLTPLSENGEIQAGTMSESQELVTLTTFARRIRVTRPMLVNDDLGAFTDFASMIGRRVAERVLARAFSH